MYQTIENKDLESKYKELPEDFESELHIFGDMVMVRQALINRFLYNRQALIDRFLIVR